jgi:GNAT superfamily N-acetyltransferase
MNVLVQQKRIDEAPQLLQVPAIAVDRLKLPEDAAAWLALRQRAFAGEDPPVRAWTADDLYREMGGSQNRDVRRITWVARPAHCESSRCDFCGAISLSPPVQGGDMASVHWLMVDPGWRRQRIGSLLVCTAERHCWEQGWRRLRLETHRGWTAAVEFYARLGFT